MRATLRHIYLGRTANMSRRTCVVVKQIQSNQYDYGAHKHFFLLNVVRLRFSILYPHFYMRDESLLYYGMAHVVRQSVNIWPSTGVTTCRFNFNFTDIIHLVRPIHDTGSGTYSSLNMHILTQLLIFAFWSFLRPFFKLEPSNLVQLGH